MHVKTKMHITTQMKTEDVNVYGGAGEDVDKHADADAYACDYEGEDADADKYCN